MGDRGTEKKGPSDASQGYWKTRILIAGHHTSLEKKQNKTLILKSRVPYKQILILYFCRIFKLKFIYLIL